ncbi:hypothetical protein GLOIN_2v1583333, partial [Rhizophagus irregularis DAOM 181602=DAOM 197198]
SKCDDLLKILVKYASFEDSDEIFLNILTRNVENIKDLYHFIRITCRTNKNLI